MSGSRRALGLVAFVAVAAAVVLGVQALRNSTEYRGGPGARGERTAVTFEVRTKNFWHGSALAAQTLWQTCVNTLGWTSVSHPARLRANTFRAEITPSLAEDTKRRLRGCLNEATLPRIEGHVTAEVDEPTNS